MSEHDHTSASSELGIAESIPVNILLFKSILRQEGDVSVSSSSIKDTNSKENTESNQGIFVLFGNDFIELVSEFLNLLEC